MKPPRVTVLMSVHNGGRWLRSAIDSVLAQSWRDYEFLILDDASTDDSAAQIEAAADSRIRLVRLDENIGLTRCLNLGLREARGEFIARQDADDLSHPGRLTRQIAFLEAHPNVTLVGAQARLIDAAGRSRGVRDLPVENVSVRWLSLLDNPVIHTAAMFRTAVIRDQLGGYDESFPCCQDYDLWARVFERFTAANLSQRLVSVREREGSISATRKLEAAEMVRRVVQRLARQWAPKLAQDARAIGLICAYRRHLTPEESDLFGNVLARFDAEFVTRFPEAARSRDLARTRANVLARIGYNLITQDRAAAGRYLAHALRAWPGIAARVPWVRAAALFALGGRARELLERVRG